MTGTYDLSQFASVEDLIERIQVGTIDKYLWRKEDDEFVDVPYMFSGTQPELVW